MDINLDLAASRVEDEFFVLGTQVQLSADHESSVFTSPWGTLEESCESSYRSQIDLIVHFDTEGNVM